MSNFMAASNQNQNPNKSFEVTHLPNDSISSLSFSPKSSILVATSWDNQVCYDWSKGAENHNPATAKNCIYLHVPQEADVKGKPRINTGKR